MRIHCLRTRALATLPCFLALLLYPTLSFSSGLVVHDDTFIPNTTLHITLQTIHLNCRPRLSILVNGTYPGPAIYLNPEETTWIRVYNDVEDVNFTMVPF